jgi:hypothetical protein
LVWFLVSILVIVVVLILYWKEQLLWQRQTEEIRRERFFLQEKLLEEQIARQQRETQLREEQIARQRQQSFRVGSYYSTIEQVWGIQSMLFYDYHFLHDIQHLLPPNFVARGVGDEKSIYNETLKYASAQYTMATDNQSSSWTSHSSTNEKVQMWPKDIFGEDPAGSEIAHFFVPASPN